MLRNLDLPFACEHSHLLSLPSETRSSRGEKDSRAGSDERRPQLYSQTTFAKDRTQFDYLSKIKRLQAIGTASEVNSFY